MKGHRSHSLPREKSKGMISRLETCRGTEATHLLESKAEESSAGLKYAWDIAMLTCCRVKNVQISKLETHQGMLATYFLKSQGQALSPSLKHSKAQ
jgi:hypothetical protein